MNVDWGGLMRAAVVAGVRPCDFWGLSLKEWGMLCGGGSESASMPRAALEAMMRDWPDEMKPETEVGVGL